MLATIIGRIPQLSTYVRMYVYQYFAHGIFQTVVKHVHMYVCTVCVHNIKYVHTHP